MSKKKKTHWKKLTNPNYLGTYAFHPGEEKVLTIQNVKQEEVTSPDGGEEKCTVVYFKEDVKPFILNITNAKQIERIYDTPYIEDWPGKKIKLYVADNIKAFGETVTGLRIRPEVPKKTKDLLEPSHHKWAGAVKALAEGETPIETIKKHYKVDEEMEQLLKEDVEDYKKSENQ